MWKTIRSIYISLTGRVSKSTTCSKECHKELMIRNGKIIQENILKNGTHIGWRPRTTEPSFPKKYWMSQLDSLNITYNREVSVDRYYLDFLIEINDVKIDLEIDGRQHYYERDRIEHDKKRNQFLIEQGYLVYRVPWNSIKKEEGQKLMEQKVQNFYNWYQKIWSDGKLSVTSVV